MKLLAEKKLEEKFKGGRGSTGRISPDKPANEGEGRLFPSRA